MGKRWNSEEKFSADSVIGGVDGQSRAGANHELATLFPSLFR